MLDVRRLRLLRELKIRGTLAEVAEALQYSPSSVSQQLALLEKEAGVELLRKTGRRVQLTPAGRSPGGPHGPAAGNPGAGRGGPGRVADHGHRNRADRRLPVRGAGPHAGHPDPDDRQLPGSPDRNDPARTGNGPARDVGPRLRPGDRRAVSGPRRPALRRTGPRQADHATPSGSPFRRRPTAGPPSARSRTPRGSPGSWSRAARPPGTGPSRPAGAPGFEPDVRFETADLQAQIRLIESGNAVALMPDLVWTGRGTTAQLLDLPGDPHRTVFTSVRRSSAQAARHPGRPRDPGRDGGVNRAAESPRRPDRLPRTGPRDADRRPPRAAVVCSVRHSAAGAPR